MTEEKKAASKKTTKKADDFLKLAEKEVDTLGKALEKLSDKPASETNILKTQYELLKGYVSVSKTIAKRAK